MSHTRGTQLGILGINNSRIDQHSLRVVWFKPGQANMPRSRISSLVVVPSEPARFLAGPSNSYYVKFGTVLIGIRPLGVLLSQHIWPTLGTE